MKRTLERQSIRQSEVLHSAVVAAGLNGEVLGDYTQSGATEMLSDSSRRRIKRAFDLVVAIRNFPRAQRDSWDEKAIEELDQIFARYPMVFKTEANNFGMADFFRRAAHRHVHDHEAFTMESLIYLGSGIDRLSECRCGRWYFRGKSNKISCSIACRKRKHEQTPEYKARKAAKAKDNCRARAQGFGIRTKLKRSKAS